MTKSKFAGLAQARLKDLETDSEAGSLEPSVPAPASKPKARKKAVKQVSKATRRQVNKSTSKDDSEKLMLIGARTPPEIGAWWLYQARMQKTTLQDAIVEALEKRFGLPKKVRLK